MNINSLNNLINTSLNKTQDKAIVEEVNLNFKDMIDKAIDELNHKQLKADELTYDFITGELEDLHSVLIATEEARLSLELAVQVRNKCIEAYKEINNMQL